MYYDPIIVIGFVLFFIVVVLYIGITNIVFHFEEKNRLANPPTFCPGCGCPVAETTGKLYGYSYDGETGKGKALRKRYLSCPSDPTITGSWAWCTSEYQMRVETVDVASYCKEY